MSEQARSRACDHPRCDGEIHWTGRKESDTGADEEEGACPVGGD